MTDWNPVYGGAESYVMALRGSLIDAGDEVQLLTANVSTRATQAADHLAPASDRVLAKSLLQLSNPFAAATVRRVVRTFQPDVVLINMFALYLSPSAIFALGNLPYLLLVSDYKCICPLGHRLLPDNSVCHHPVGIACLRNRCLSLPHWLRDLARYRRIDQVVRKAAAIVSISDSLHDSLLAQGIDSQRVYLFSDPPNTLLPRQCAATPLFLFVGRLDVEKGVDTLLHAFAIAHARMPEARLRIIGQGGLRAALERLSKRLELKDSVTFCGWQEPNQINIELSHAWALVAPSRWPEPFGLVALEAMLRAVPVVVPSSGGFAETVDHGVTGLLFPPEDVTALAERLLDIATGRSFPEHILDSSQVTRVQQRYGRDQHIAHIRAIMQEIVPFQQH